jgi:hypothetical protein
VVTPIEYAIYHKVIALEALLDMIKHAAERHGIEPAITQMDLWSARKQKYKCYTVRRDPKGVRGQRVPSGKSAFTPAVELGYGLPSMGTQQ